MPLFTAISRSETPAAGRFCGVDDEMQILQETGCYVDMTLPSAPDETQVPMLNHNLRMRLAADGKNAAPDGNAVSQLLGNQPQLPLIFTGPLVFNWTRRIKGVPVPRLDDGALVYNQPTGFGAAESLAISADVNG